MGRSLIVNKRYIHVINLTEHILMFSGQALQGDIKPLHISRDALKALKEILEKEKGGEYE